MNKIYEGKFLKKSIIDGKEYYRFIISTDDVDRYGEVIDIDGVDVSEYERTGSTVFYNHDYYSRMPIGTSIITKEKGKLYGDVWFDESDELSRTVKKKVDAGVITNASIGFEVVEFEEKAVDDKKLKRKFNKIKVYTKTILIEWSVVAIPANVYANLQRKYLENKDLFNNFEENMKTKKGAKLSQKNKQLILNAISNLNEVVADEEFEEFEETEESSDEITALKQLISRNDVEIQKLKEQISNLRNDNDLETILYGDK